MENYDSHLLLLFKSQTKGISKLYIPVVILSLKGSSKHKYHNYAFYFSKLFMNDTDLKH